MRRRTGNFLAALVIAMGLSTFAASDATAGGKRNGATNHGHHGGEHNYHGDHAAPYGWLWGVAIRGGHHR
jgi:hypothetical protein